MEVGIRQLRDHLSRYVEPAPRAGHTRPQQRAAAGGPVSDLVAEQRR
ncbi:MAG TPA: hypothetical protein VG452_04570 [Egibacteraceae bacterium]|nr:hypothetical protein [Actinomycetota bacterium]HWB71471.1 hypothetical protein [Egibacteraceae bacterium]